MCILIIEKLKGLWIENQWTNRILISDASEAMGILIIEQILWNFGYGF